MEVQLSIDAGILPRDIEAVDLLNEQGERSPHAFEPRDVSI